MIIKHDNNVTFPACLNHFGQIFGDFIFPIGKQVGVDRWLIELYGTAADTLRRPDPLVP